ncbi:hypothetical protein A7U60_g2713 [Sanghuangporus baumii]|uniref:Uncharacterized protein n=1 Tax=Sanghuangporus baumii TaxID=108892 RepID=A0A9Q5NDP3_SANBA|nr:hypothetical protein A7U60_g2713 [Sanghuangporus baumii]
MLGGHLRTADRASLGSVGGSKAVYAGDLVTCYRSEERGKELGCRPEDGRSLAKAQSAGIQLLYASCRSREAQIRCSLTDKEIHYVAMNGRSGAHIDDRGFTTAAVSCVFEHDPH